MVPLTKTTSQGRLSDAASEAKLVPARQETPSASAQRWSASCEVSFRYHESKRALAERRVPPISSGSRKGPGSVRAGSENDGNWVTIMGNHRLFQCARRP